jgi:atlastin
LRPATTTPFLLVGRGKTQFPPEQSCSVAFPDVAHIVSTLVTPPCNDDSISRLVVVAYAYGFRLSVNQFHTINAPQTKRNMASESASEEMSGVVSSVSPSISDTDDSAVLVEHNDGVPKLEDEDGDETNNKAASVTVTGAACACQIVSIDETNTFVFHKEALDDILGRVPPKAKVAVVAVVGAFRTGKSFLLSWFLRYLHAKQQPSTSKLWYEQFQSLGNDGFDWRAGAERNTTGIWMWSHPHMIEQADGEPLAVILVDTQGMFDHETSVALTASIFGFSTLLSSYQIYNVDKRIQEDNLQQLALFSEYARTAASEEAAGEDRLDKFKPFQRIEFLVRDWQHFEEEDDLAAMQQSMETYLESVIQEREAKDLKETREQIVGCFEEITCFGLCHPGFAVTKKKYTGDISTMEEQFLSLLDHYCNKVFSSLAPKIIHGRELTATELGAYIQAYAELFTTGADKFPTASTMLEATASANNTNAVNLALTRYQDAMDRIAGANCSTYHAPEELEEDHERALTDSLRMFDSVANFGNNTMIDEARKKLQSQNFSSFKMYRSLNDSRNPLLGLETYM